MDSQQLKSSTAGNIALVVGATGITGSNLALKLIEKQ